MSKTLQMPFTILKPIWLRWWFIVCEIIFLALLIRVYVKFREKKLNETKLKLEKIVEERTLEVREKAKEIEVQSNLISEKNKELTDSIKYAERIQKTLLANKNVMKANLPEHFILFKPKDIVSGDFYWATSVRNSELGEGSAMQANSELRTPNSEFRTLSSELFFLAVCDSTGHGVPGAFMSLLNISFLNEAISEKHIVEPNLVLNYVRNKLIEDLSYEGARDGMDGTLICYDKKNNVIKYSSAYNKPILVRDDVIKELPADKMPIGKGEKDESFTLQTIELIKGDILYFYTDGFADQFGGPKGKKYKYKQLNELLFTSSKLSLNEQSKILEEKFVSWKGNLEQVDDVLLIGIKI